ncbi:hypothetical protein ACN28C_24855 [Plantactinospora sp. WMMC1484]|uniref:hypothetical protein n=1 Tax=Plantactinospora sp. WMMC1484 TaxID=3404122 RepID=UPI003BF4B8CA
MADERQPSRTPPRPPAPRSGPARMATVSARATVPAPGPEPVPPGRVGQRGAPLLRAVGLAAWRALDPRITARLRTERLRAEALAAPLRPGSIAVVGPVQHSGRSTVAALVALALARHQGPRVLAVDAAGGGGLHGRLAAGSGGSTGTVLAGLGIRDADLGRRSGAVSHRWLRERLALAESMMLLAPAPGTVDRPVGAQEYAPATTALARWFPLLVTDTPPLTADRVVPVALTRAERVVIVVPDDERRLERLERSRSWIAPLLWRPIEEVAVNVLVQRDAARSDALAPKAEPVFGVPTFSLRYDPALRAPGPLRWPDLAPQTRETVLALVSRIVRDMRSDR